jgi:hypothetical protein
MCVVIYVTIVITYVTIICDYYMFGWKSKMKVDIFHPILWMDPWIDENLIVFAIGHICFGN